MRIRRGCTPTSSDSQVLGPWHDKKIMGEVQVLIAKVTMPVAPRHETAQEVSYLRQCMHEAHRQMRGLAVRHPRRCGDRMAKRRKTKASLWVLPIFSEQ